jgi:tetratricopeptide (TPR) repeat protein
MNSVAAKSGLSADRPFPGLRPYRFEDQQFFFGREDQIFSLYRLFDHSRFVAVVGSSGSGKSSLVRAGLLPLLERESGEPTGRTWAMIQMHPGDAPIASLAAAMAERFFPDDDRAIRAARRERIRFALRQSSFGMADALREIAGLGATSIILVVDQFEELFRYATAKRQSAERDDDAGRHEEATQFVQLLLASSRDRALNVYVLLTMRSDFIGDCASFQGLPEAVSASQFLVPSLTRDQREEAIRGPLTKAGAVIEPALVERLLNDSGSEIDQLPVLQHCLLRIWEAARAAGGAAKLTLDHYVNVGGIAHALSQHADEVLKSLPSDELTVEQTFRSLAEIDNEGRIIRRARLFKDLLAETGVGAQSLWRVVDRFRDDDCSFLTPPKSETPEHLDSTRIDVGHEALLRCWERVSGDQRSGAQYTGWIREEAADGRAYRNLLGMAESGDKIGTDTVEQRWKRWQERPRTPAWAERYGGHLQDVERLFGDSLAALEAQRDRERRQAQAERDQERRHIEEAEERKRMQLEADRSRERENAALRFARLAWAAAIVGFVLLIFACGAGFLFYRQSGIANQQRQEAESQRQEAETQRQQAIDQQTIANQQRQIAENNLQTAQNNLKSSIKIATDLLNQVQQQFNTGEISAGNAKQLLTDAASIFSLFGSFQQTADILTSQINLDLAFADTSATLQDNNSALQYAQNAKALAMQLIATDKTNTDYMNLLYQATFRIGDAQAELSEFAASLQTYQEAAAISQALATADPTNVDSRQQAAFVMDKIGDAYDLMGQPQQALNQYLSALQIDQTLANADPSNASFQRDLATALIRVGDAQAEGGDAAGALARYQSALTIRATLSQSAPNDVTLQSNLSVAYNRVAGIFVQQGKFDDAEKLYTTALAIRTKLATNDPGNFEWQSDLAFEYVYIARMATAKKDYAGAAQNYRSSLTIRTALAAGDVNNLTWAKNLADSYTGLAAALADLGNLADALSAHEAALPLRVRIGAQYADTASRQHELISEYVAIGDIYLTRGDKQAAQSQYQSALAVAQAFQAKHPGNTALAADLTAIQQKLAKSKA